MTPAVDTIQAQIICPTWRQPEREGSFFRLSAGAEKAGRMRSRADVMRSLTTAEAVALPRPRPMTTFCRRIAIGDDRV